MRQLAASGGVGFSYLVSWWVSIMPVPKDATGWVPSGPLCVSEGAGVGSCSGWGQAGHLSQVRRGLGVMLPWQGGARGWIVLWAEFQAVLLALQVG